MIQLLDPWQNGRIYSSQNLPSKEDGGKLQFSSVIVAVNLSSMLIPKLRWR